MQIVKDFYSNMVDSSSKRLEVIVRETQVKYSVATTNMMLRVKNVGDTCQIFLETFDEDELDVHKDSLCNPCMNWMDNEKSHDKTIFTMYL